MKIEKHDAENFKVDGIELHKYIEGNQDKPADILHISVNEEHEREFSNSESHFIYYVIEGNGAFWVNGKQTLNQPTSSTYNQATEYTTVVTWK